MRLVRPVGAAAASLLVATVLSVVTGSPASADLDTPCLPDEADVQSAKAGAPITSMRIAEAHQWLQQQGLPEAGTGVVVAVVDSGVATTPQISVFGKVSIAPIPEVTYYHGTAVAGIVAGKAEGTQTIGIAPAATILDVKVYDNDEADATDGTTPISAQSVSAGLNAVLVQKQNGVPIKVANVSAAVGDSVDLSLAVEALWKAGVIVVASSGNRGMSQDDPLFDDFGTYEPGEDAVDEIYPAAYPKVVAAATTADDGASGTDATQYILRNSAIDVAVPTSGAPTYSLETGASCVLKTPATSWAAAEVSGVLAMLASTYPDDRPAQLVSRLLNTTDGRDDVRSPLTGAGVAQPYEALTRPLVISRNGKVDASVPINDQQPATLPVTEADPLDDTRSSMVWFGVVGGGVLVLALVLRPVLARRRRSA